MADTLSHSSFELLYRFHAPGKLEPRDLKISPDNRTLITVNGLSVRL